MNYKSLNKLFTFYCLLFCVLFSIGQEQGGDTLIEHITAYGTLETNEERDKHLRSVNAFAGEFTSETINTKIQNHLSKKEKRKLASLIDFYRAENFRANFDFKSATSIYEALINRLELEDTIDPVLLSISFMKSGNAHSFKYDAIANGLKKYSKGIRYAEISQVPRSVLDFHIGLGFYNARLGDHNTAKYHYGKALNIANELSDTLQIVSLIGSQMDYYISREDPESSLKVWSKIKDYQDKLEFEDLTKSMNYHRVVDTYILLKEHDSALYYSDILLKTDVGKFNDLRKPANLSQRAHLFKSMGNTEEALQLYSEAFKLAKSKRLSLEFIRAAIGRANLLIANNQLYEAEKTLKDAYLSIDRIEPKNIIEIEIELAELYESKNELDSALVYRKKIQKHLEIINKRKAEEEIALSKAKLEIEGFEETFKNLDDKVVQTKKAYKYLIICVVVFGLFIALFLYNRNQRNKLKNSIHEEQIANKERIAIEAELNTIRSQMNPHFMFNSLNSINEFIQSDSSEDASNYLVKFSRLMRSTLNYSKRKFVTLEEEIDLLKLYVELENLRFYNSIDFSLTINPSIDMDTLLIPPMMIQPFVENAIWHGLMAKADHRKLNLSFSESEHNIICEIEDNGIGRVASAEHKAKKPSHTSQGIGLTQRRLELLKSIHGKEARVDVIDLTDNEKAIGTLVKVILPKHMDA